MFVAGWRHALRSEWPFIIIIIIQHFCKSTSLIKLFAIESTEKYRLIGEIGDDDDDEVAVPCNNFPYNPNKKKCHANTRYKVWRMSRNV